MVRKEDLRTLPLHLLDNWPCCLEDLGQPGRNAGKAGTMAPFVALPFSDTRIKPLGAGYGPSCLDHAIRLPSPRSRDGLTMSRRSPHDIALSSRLFGCVRHSGGLDARWTVTAWWAHALRQNRAVLHSYTDHSTPPKRCRPLAGAYVPVTAHQGVRWAIKPTP